MRGFDRHARSLCLSALLALATPAAPAFADGALYDNLGGRVGLARIVNNLLELWVIDPRVTASVDDARMARLKPRLLDMLCAVAEGPCEYKARFVPASAGEPKHAQAKFRAVMEDLQASMQKAGVSAWTQNTLIARLAPYGRDIITW